MIIFEHSQHHFLHLCSEIVTIRTYIWYTNPTYHEIIHLVQWVATPKGVAGCFLGGRRGYVDACQTQAVNQYVELFNIYL